MAVVSRQSWRVAAVSGCGCGCGYSRLQRLPAVLCSTVCLQFLPPVALATSCPLMRCSVSACLWLCESGWCAG